MPDKHVLNSFLVVDKSQNYIIGKEKLYVKVGIGIVSYMGCICSVSLLGPLEYSYSKRVKVFIHI